jgi:predicted Zn-dependent protease
MITYSEIMLEKVKTEKAYTYLNHCLKLDYRNPGIWSLLGDLYTMRANKASSISYDEKTYCIEKAAFSFSKAAKYES